MLVPAQSFIIVHSYTIANHIVLPLVYNTNPLKEQMLTMQRKKTIELHSSPIKQLIASIDKHVRNWKSSDTVSGNVKWCDHFRKHSVSSLKS